MNNVLVAITKQSTLWPSHQAFGKMNACIKIRVGKEAKKYPCCLFLPSFPAFEELETLQTSKARLSAKKV